MLDASALAEPPEQVCHEVATRRDAIASRERLAGVGIRVESEEAAPMEEELFRNQRSVVLDRPAVAIT
jgi:hypothetical protein